MIQRKVVTVSFTAIGPEMWIKSWTIWKSQYQIQYKHCQITISNSMHQIWIETIWYFAQYDLNDLKSICQIGAGLSDSARWFDAHQMKSVFVIVKYQILFFFSVLRVSPWNQIVPLLGMEYLKIWFDTHLWDLVGSI